jgi:hypothetical protein
MGKYASLGDGLLLWMQDSPRHIQIANSWGRTLVNQLAQSASISTLDGPISTGDWKAMIEH